MSVKISQVLVRVIIKLVCNLLEVVRGTKLVKYFQIMNLGTCQLEDNLNHCIRKTWFSFLVKRLKVNFVWMSEAIFYRLVMFPNRLEVFSFFGGKWGGFLKISGSPQSRIRICKVWCKQRVQIFNRKKENPMNFRGLRRSGGLDSSSRKHATGAMDATLQTPTNATNAACAEREREKTRLNAGFCTNCRR